MPSKGACRSMWLQCAESYSPTPQEGNCSIKVAAGFKVTLYSVGEKCTTCAYYRFLWAPFPSQHSKLPTAGVADQLCLDNKIMKLGRFHGTACQPRVTVCQV